MTQVQLNKYECYSLKEKPSVEELRDYYQKKYFQNEKGTYSNSYSKQELQYFYNKIDQKYQIIRRYIHGLETGSFLDVGCGECFTLKYFRKKGWDVFDRFFCFVGHKCSVGTYCVLNFVKKGT